MLQEQGKSRNRILTLLYFHLPIIIEFHFKNSVVYQNHTEGSLFSQEEKSKHVQSYNQIHYSDHKWDGTNTVV